jgi:hypothetical protein
MDGAGNLYFGGDTILEWAAANSSVTTVLSNGLCEPFGLEIDVADNVYIMDRECQDVDGVDEIDVFISAFVDPTPPGGGSCFR